LIDGSRGDADAMVVTVRQESARVDGTEPY